MASSSERQVANLDERPRYDFIPLSYQVRGRSLTLSRDSEPILTKLPSGDYACPFPGCANQERHKKNIGRHINAQHRNWAESNSGFMKAKFNIDIAYKCHYCGEKFTRSDNVQRHLREGRCQAVNQGGGN